MGNAYVTSSRACASKITILPMEIFTCTSVSVKSLSGHVYLIIVVAVEEAPPTLKISSVRDFTPKHVTWTWWQVKISIDCNAIFEPHVTACARNVAILDHMSRGGPTESKRSTCGCCQCGCDLCCCETLQSALRVTCDHTQFDDLTLSQRALFVRCPRKC